MKMKPDLLWQEVVWQRPYSLETELETLTHLASATSRGAIVWEVRGNRNKVRYLLGVERIHCRKIRDLFTAHGDIRFAEIEDDSLADMVAARQLKITKPLLSLKTDITLSTLRAGLAAMTNIPKDGEVVLQIILGRSFAPTPAPSEIQDPHASWFNVAVGNVGKASSESLATIRDKVSQHEFAACVRIGISKGVNNATFYNVLSALKTLESAGVRINAVNENPEAVNNAHIPWRFPLRLSVKEVANFLMLPVGDTELAGVAGAHPKLILPPTWYKNPSSEQGRTFAVNGNTRLSISPKDALEHTVILGPTGSGKSTAMLNLIMSDISAGRSVLVIDPKEDLVNEVLERIPTERDKDVVVLSPPDTCPVGFNPLNLKGYGNPSLVSDAVFTVFKEIFAENWGIRTQEVLSAAFLTLAQTKGATLLWLPKLLTDEAFRRKITAGLKDKIGLIPYWDNFNAMKESERRAEVAPVLNKINSFMFRPELRNVLGQSNPKFSLMDLFTERKIVLVPLNKGTIGGENARLLGSLIVGLTWTLALSRANIPKEKRHMVSIFIDELQDYLSLPTDLSDALAQARGLGVAITMAHQYRDQLPPKIRAGIDANARNKIIFGLEGDDAKEMASKIPGLEVSDFVALPRYSVYTSFMSSGINTGWVSGKTLPATPAKRLPAELRAKSMARYGKPAEETEAEYLALLTKTDTDNTPDNAFDDVGRAKQ